MVGIGKAKERGLKTMGKQIKERLKLGLQKEF
jgi:hypothetical protein